MKLGVVSWVRMVVPGKARGYLLIGGKKGYEGLYLTPGGGVEDHESAEAAVIREVEEETGVVVRDPTFVTYFERLEPAREHIVVLLFSAWGRTQASYGELPRAGSDAGEVRLVSVEELVDLQRAGRLSPLTEQIADVMFGVRVRRQWVER